MMKKLELTGSPTEIGYEHGSKGKKEVLHSLETYEKLFYGFKKLKWDQVKVLALEHMKAIERYDVTLIEEMEGVARGAGVDFEDILALNARSEIALTSSGNKFSDGCTTVAITEPLSADTIIGQNWDWTPSQKSGLLVLNIKSKENPEITMVTEGGIIGKIGYNSAGIGLCFNALLTDVISKEVPLHLGLRGVLKSYTQGEAISKVANGKIAASASLMIGYDDGNGNGMTVNPEVSPHGMDYVGGDNSWLAHTNHVCSPILLEQLREMNDLKHEDSILRQKRIHQLIKRSVNRGEKITEDTFKLWFQDTFNKPSSINQYSNLRAPEHRRMETLFSIIINLSKREAMLRIGLDGEYEKI